MPRAHDPMRGLTARDIMETRPTTVRPDDTVHHVVRLLLRERRTSVPVVDGGRVVGLITEKGCVNALIRAVEYQLPPSRVADVMTTELTMLPSDAHVLTVAGACKRSATRRVLVVDDGQLVGVITRRDLLRATVKVFDTAPSREAAVLYLSATGSAAPVAPRRMTPDPGPAK